MPNFEDVDLGDEIGPLETEATDAGVVSFCQVWDNPIPNRFTDPEAARLFDSAAVGHERRWRQEPLSRAAVRVYLTAVRDRVLDELDRRELTAEVRDLVLLCVFHEDMHAEAFTYMRQALGLPPPNAATSASPSAGLTRRSSGSKASTVVT